MAHGAEPDAEVVGRDAVIGGEREHQTAAEAVSLHGCDDRHGDAVQLGRHCQPVAEPLDADRLGVERLDVDASGERAAVPGEHDGVDRVGSDERHLLAHPSDHLRAERERLGTVHPQPGDRTFVDEGDRHEPPTRSRMPDQYGSRSSLSTLPAPDFGSGSARSSITFGTL